MKSIKIVLSVFALFLISCDNKKNSNTDSEFNSVEQKKSFEDSLENVEETQPETGELNF